MFLQKHFNFMYTAIGVANDPWIEDGGHGPVQLVSQNIDQALHQEAALELQAQLGIRVCRILYLFFLLKYIIKIFA